MLVNLVRHLVSGITSGVVTLGAAVPGYLTVAQAGGANGVQYTYALREGNKREVGRGTYTASGTTFSRTRILASTNGNAAESFTTAAIFSIVAAAEDFRIGEIPTHNTAPIGSRLMQLEVPSTFVPEWVTLAEMFASMKPFIGVKAYNSASQDATTTQGVMALNTEVIDSGGFFASNAYTPPAGFYFVAVTQTLLPAAHGFDIAATIFLEKNGSGSAEAADSGLLSASAAVFLKFATLIQVNGTDVLRLKQFTDTANITGGWQGAPYNAFVAYKVD